MISLAPSWKNQALLCFLSRSHFTSQQNQAVYPSFIIHLEDHQLFKAAHSSSLALTNQRLWPHRFPPPLPWYSTAGSHSRGLNLSRLEHSAKGHYPGLHVCWAAVLSNSTRCCCDHWVTCKDSLQQLHFFHSCHNFIYLWFAFDRHGIA